MVAVMVRAGSALTVAALVLASCGGNVPLSPARADYPYRPAPFTDVRLSDSFWAPRVETNRTVTVPYCFRKCEETGRIDNFAKAGGLIQGPFVGLRYNDSDVFKVIEGAAYSLALHPDPELDAYLDVLISKIAAAQESDGYLYTARTIGRGDDMRRIGPRRWSNLITSHELYNVGHLYEAAVAHYRATGKRTLLDVAVKNADLIARTFGPDGVRDVPGHEEIEIGLVKLYRVTGERAYLKTAKFFIDERGDPDRHTMEHPERGRWYMQDHLPVKQQTEAVGHAVRAGYLYAGVADVAALTGEAGYLEALERIWESVVGRRMYLTGGVGAHRSGERFGEDYELPNGTAYAETCAAIANALWQHRMFLLTGDAKYIDVLERVLYNGFLAGVSLSGDRFFYPNPLAADGETKFNQGHATRAPWFRTSCCPVNVVRTMPSIPGYVYALRGGEVYVNLFIQGEARVPVAGGTVVLRQRTRYPWDGDVTIEVRPPAPLEFALQVRIPGWARNRPVPTDLYRYVDEPAGEPSIAVNGRPAPLDLSRGYVRIERTWAPGDTVSLRLPMPVRLVAAHEAVEADRGRLAIERGPLVYCVEGIDNGGRVDGITLSRTARFEVEHRPELLGGVTVIRWDGRTAIPYYAWSNRGEGPMAVWLPEARP